ncbi:hypothetical protein VMUT_1500 [Vulcanisaeta moutnovskia 768-28]|uniref:Uncharacterized protein n=1 Tax=Vulcanisaeta moutnovskia (strain 768-28) TaxID=985053 RepID=F0QTJ2_VULM7|nr:hypothetical protein [Vulcanisaeta moutnovskia]ADY01705.1 hypothetical protein VMUT_1500 [Vulcanisaeta moutnovskia 768-28]
MILCYLTLIRGLSFIGIMAILLSLGLMDPYAAAESAIQGIVSNTVDFMAFVAAVLILMTIAGLGLLGFLALVQSLIGYSLIEWSSIRRIIGALAAMGVVLVLLMGILPAVLNSVGLTAIATALNGFMSMVMNHLSSLI